MLKPKTKELNLGPVSLPRILAFPGLLTGPASNSSPTFQVHVWFLEGLISPTVAVLEGEVQIVGFIYAIRLASTVAKHICPFSKILTLSIVKPTDVYSSDSAVRG